MSVVSYRFIGASILYHCMMKAIKFRLCIIKFKCYTFCGKTRVMNYFIIYFIKIIIKLIIYLIILPAKLLAGVLDRIYSYLI